MVQDLAQRMRQRLADHQAGKTQDETALEVASTGEQPQTGDLVSRLQDRVQQQTPLGISDAWQEIWSGGWKEKLPFFGGAVTAKKYHSLWESARRIESGTQTADDENLILAFVAESQREQGIGYMVGSILSELPGFVTEFAVSGGAWNLGKKGALKLASKSMREGIEKAAAKLTLRGVKEKTLGQAAKAGVAKGMGAMVNTTGQLGAMTIMGEIAGGSRVSAEAWRRALPEMSLSVDDADRLALTFHTTATDFVDQLPAAVLDQFIELLSERSGQALMAGAAKIPGIGYVAAMQAEVADWWIKKYPGGMTKLMQTVAKKGGWHGPVAEFLEERFGGAMRGATGINEGGILENTFPGLEQGAAELIAFSVPGALGTGAQLAFQTPEPEDQRAGFEATEGESRRTFAKSELDAMAQGQAQELEQELELPHGTISVAEETPEGFETITEDFRQRGLSAFFVGTAEGKPLPVQARLGEEGIVLVDINMEADPAEVGIHELVHELDRVAPEAAEKLELAGRRLDGEAYSKFLADYEAAYEAEVGRPLPEEFKGTEGRANYAEMRASLIYMARTADGRMALQQLVQNNRSLAQKLIDWMVRGLNTLGLDVRQAQQIRLDRLSKALGEDVTVEGVETALLFQEALDVMVGRTAAVDRVVTPLLGAGPVPLQLPETAEGPRGMEPGVRPSERPGEATPEVAESHAGRGASQKGREPSQRKTPVTPSVIPLEGQAPEEKPGKPLSEEPPVSPEEEEGASAPPTADQLPKPGATADQLPERHEMAELDADEVAFKLHEGVDLSTYQARSKQEEELIEVGVSALANDIAATPGATKEWIFEQLVSLYSRQPRPNIRTTESVLAQQYSTPAPLAYVAWKMLGPRVGTVYEPSAGHGLLLTGLARKKWATQAILNELNLGRNNRLANLAATLVHAEDAAEWSPEQFYETVIANPPFGTVLGDDLKTTRRRISLGEGSSFETSQVDHQIVAKALEGLPDDGQAVLIIGSQKSLKRGEKAREEGRRAAYASGQKRLFFRDLYKNWNVTDHVTVSGDLYKNQGAAWPIDIIVIKGRGQSKLALPGSLPPQVLESWDEVQSLLDAKRRKSYRQLRKDQRGGREPGSLPATGDQPGAPSDREGAGGRDPVPGEGVRGGPGVGPGSQRPSDTGAGALPGERGGEGADAALGRPGSEVAEEGAAQPPGEVGVRGGGPGGLAGGPGSGGPLDLDDLIDGALDDAFGAEEKAPAPKKKAAAKKEPKLFSRVRDYKAKKKYGRGRTFAIERGDFQDKGKRRRKPPIPPPRPDISPEDQGLADIAGLFSLAQRREGFDQAKYDKIAPAFTAKLDKAGIDPSDTPGIVSTIIGYFQDVLKLTRQQINNVRLYIKEFVEDIRAGEITWGERTKDQPSEPNNDLPEETEGQVRYKGLSKSRALSTLLPRNMQTAMEQALRSIQEEHGDIDEYVAGELGWEIDRLHRVMGQEQVDAVALAIQNAQNGAAFVLGDQTGVGKGRIVAAMIHWARRNGQVPVFMTQDKGLYADMFRDLYDISVTDINPYITDAPFTAIEVEGAEHPVTEKPIFVRSQAKKKREDMEAEMEKTGALPKGYNAVFTTYSQSTLKKAQKVGRHRAIEALAPNAFFILDESHNAGGQEIDEAEQKKIDEGKKFPRAQWIRDLLEASAGAMFSSATFAKNPHVMTLYAKTDMGKAFAELDTLTSVIKKGGVPMQQILSNMLVQAGQYVRREKSFKGIEFGAKDVDVSMEAADTASGTMRELFTLDYNHMETVRADYIRVILPVHGGAAFGDKAVGTRGSDSSFASTMHNLIGQAMLAMKANAVADEAISEWKQGRKPIIALDSTMGEMLKRTIEQEGLSVGQKLSDPSFRHAILKYLESTRTISLKDDDGFLLDRIFITDAEMIELGHEHRLQAYNEVKKLIEGVELGDMTMSPIDQILQRMQAAGMKVEEITGRGWTIGDLGGENRVRTRHHTSATKKGTMKAFNSGVLDGLVINRSGSTGFSLHAGEKFKDQRQRIMLIAQPAQNIDDYMQVLGRINRTGQVIERGKNARDFEGGAYGLPIYRVMFANLPHEMRAKAMLQNKMKALNASTTASAGSAVTLGGVTDFINRYGDQVVYEMLRENPGLTSQLHLFKRIFPQNDRDRPPILDLAKQTTNRLPVLTVAEQRSLYEQIDSSYKAYIAYLDSVGLNTLEAKLEELDAKTLSSEVVQQETGPSVFEGAVYEERVDIVKLRPPVAYEEMEEKVQEVDTAPMAAAVQEAADARVADIRKRQAEAEALATKAVAEIAKLGPTEPDTPEANKKARLRDREVSLTREADRLKLTAEKVPSDAAALRQLLESVAPGKHLALVMRQGDDVSAPVHGLVTRLVHKKKAKSALAASDYEITIYTTATTAPLKLPLSKLRSGITVIDASQRDVMDAVAAERASGREERSIVTGNLLRGAGSYLGKLGTRLTMYRTSEGTVKAGLLLPGNVSVADIEASLPLELSPEQAVQALIQTTKLKVSDKNGVVTAKANNYDEIQISLRPRGKGPYLKAAEPEPFTQRGGKGPYLSNWLDHVQARRTLGDFERVPGFQLQVLEKGEKARARTVLDIPAGKQGGAYSVRKRRAKHQTMGFDIGPESGMDRFRRATQDRDIRVRRFEEQLLSRGGVVPEQFSTYGAIERFPGRVEAHLRRWAREIYDPLMVHLGENEIDAADADEYAWARHAPERNKVIAKKHRDEWLTKEVGRVKAQAQRTAQKAQERIDQIAVQLASTAEARDLERLEVALEDWKVKRAEALRAAKVPMGAVGAPPADLPFQDHATKRGGSGMSDKEAAKVVKGFLEGKKGEAYQKLGELVDRMNTRTRKLQLASGLISQETYDRWDEDFEHYVPLRTAYRDQVDTYGRRFEIKRPESREARGRKSAAHSPIAFSIVQAERAILRGHKNEVGNAFLQLIEANPELVKDYEVRDDGEAHDEEEAEQIPQEALPQEGEFSTKVNGHEVYIKIRDPLLLRALMNIGVDETGPAVRVFGKVNRVLAMLNTSLDPGFMLSNFFRDLQTAGINVGGERSAKMARQVVGSTFSGKPLAAVWKGLKGKKDPSDPWLVSFHEMERAGGLTGWYTLPDFQEKLNSVQSALKDANPSNARKVWIGIKAVGETIDRANRAVENGARLSAYHHARASGASVKEAASLAKNLTVNFNRKGEWGTAMNAFYLFYNASMQGTVRMFQALKHRHVQYTVAGIAAAAFALDLINAAVGGDDDDDVPFYDKIPTWVKARNLILMSPFGDGGYLKIPLPYGYNVFHAFGQVVASLQRGAIDYGEASKQMVGVSWESFYPLGSESSFLQTVSPTLADPFVQIAENKTFWGGPIRPTPYGSPAPPDSQLYWSTVNPALKSVTDTLNSLTGGDEVVAGWADLSPEDLEHAIEFAGGGAGRQAKRVVDSLTSFFSGEEVPMHKIPILRRMAGTQDQRYDRETYIENRNDVKRAIEQLENAAGDPAAQRRVREDRGAILRMGGPMKATESRLRKIRKARRQTEDKARREQLDERTKQIQKTFNKRFQEAINQ